MASFPADRPPRPLGPNGPLTERETEVLMALARGLSNDDIAAELHLSCRTVRNYLSRCYGKLGVSTRLEAALWWAARHGSPRASSPDVSGAARHNDGAGPSDRESRR